MVEGEALRGPCDDDDDGNPTSPPRHRASFYPLQTLTDFVTIMMAVRKKSRESGSDKQPCSCNPIALGSTDGVYIYDPCSLPALALWALT